MTTNIVTADEASDTISIPADATAEGLIADAKAEFEKAGIPFTYFDKDLLQLIRQDQDLVRGKILKVITHNFGRDWETSEGRDWQKSLGTDGNTAAFLAWVMKTQPTGWFVSIANDDVRIFRHSNGLLYAPCFRRGVDHRELYHNGVWYGWDGYRSLVAFSAI